MRSNRAFPCCAARCAIVRRSAGAPSFAFLPANEIFRTNVPTRRYRPPLQAARSHCSWSARWPEAKGADSKGFLNEAPAYHLFLPGTLCCVCAGRGGFAGAEHACSVIGVVCGALPQQRESLARRTICRVARERTRSATSADLRADEPALRRKNARR